MASKSRPTRGWHLHGSGREPGTSRLRTEVSYSTGPWQRCAVPGRPTRMLAGDSRPNRGRIQPVTRALPLIALGAAVVIWSTTFVVSSEVLDGISPALLTLIRFVLAAFVLVPLALTRPGLLRMLATRTAAVLGLTGVAAYFGLQNLGLLSTSPGTAALLQAVIPIAAAVLSFLLLSERPPIGSIAGLALATIGVVIAANTGAQIDIGALLIAAGSSAYAFYTVWLRRLEAPRPPQITRPATDPLVVAAATAVWGVVFLLPWQAWELAAGQARLVLSGSLVLSTLYLGLAASGATLLLWTYGARRVPATISGILTAAIPALGYGFALLVGEEPTWNKTLGGLLALFGVGLATIGEVRGSTRPSSPARTAGGGWRVAR